MRSIHFHLLLLAFLLTTTGSLWAQAPLVWEAYQLQFTAPSDFRIEVNTRETISAGNDNLYMTMMATEDSLTIEGIADAVLFKAEELGLEDIHAGHDLELKDFSVHFVEGKKAGVYSICAALIEKTNGNVYFADILYSKGFDKQAMTIVETFSLRQK